jgi:diaminopimelate epimerase
MQLQFQKMHGAGNRIIIVDQRVENPLAPDAKILHALRESSPDDKFDQLMWLNQPENPAAVASYRVFNYDGSEVEQCGNGVRCVAVFLAAQESLQTMSLESPAGVIDARITGATSASVNMGTPQFDAALTQLIVDGALRDVSIVSMGNPHCVLDVASVEAADVAGLGPAIEGHAQFPERINVGFMQIVNRGNINLRVFERGVGETLACGTGACAAVASGHHRGLLDDDVAVHLPGGQLVVSWRGDNASLWLSGEVKFLSQGTVNL